LRLLFAAIVIKRIAASHITIQNARIDAVSRFEFSSEPRPHAISVEKTQKSGSTGDFFAFSFRFPLKIKKKANTICCVLGENTVLYLDFQEDTLYGSS